MKLVMKLLAILLAFLAVARAQVCVYRLAVSIPNANGTINVVDDSTGKTIYELENLDVTPYYNVPCANLQYSFYSGSTLLTTAKNTPTGGSITTLVLYGLFAPSGNAITTQAFADNWNVTEGTAIVRYINVAPSYGAFSIEANKTTFQPNIKSGEATEYATFPSNEQYAFYVTDVSTNEVVLDEFLFLNDQTSYTIWIQGLPESLELTMSQDYPPDVPSP
eukprot:Phypoly_transcript_14089.p1 GENE.Phypoly_transcript_14089~~Phypoly_transcript_14089.p1  ORF type:complete len:220 (+),score=33.33 Phypoly_transcript_14089:120-779(+)